MNVADLIDIAGNHPISLAPSALNSSTFSSGKANNVFVNTSRLIIRDGGALGSALSTRTNELFCLFDDSNGESLKK